MSSFMLSNFLLVMKTFCLFYRPTKQPNKNTPPEPIKESLQDLSERQQKPKKHIVEEKKPVVCMQ